MSALSVPSCLPDCTFPLLPHLHASSPTYLHLPLPPWAPSVLIGVGVRRSTCLQIMFIHVYKPLTCTGRRTWLSSTGNWELGNSHMGMGSYWVWVWVWDWVWLWFWFCAPGCPLASTSASSTHRQRFGILAFWVGDAVPTSFPLRRGYDSDSDSNPDSISFSICNLDSTRVWVRVRVRCAFYVNLLTTILAFVCALLCVAGWIPLDLGLSERSLTSCGIC